MLASLKNGCLGSAALCCSTIFEVIVALLSHFAQENVIFQNDFLTQITLPHTSLSLSLSPSASNPMLLSSFSFHRFQFMIY